jgi:hypothetical protein
MAARFNGGRGASDDLFYAAFVASVDFGWWLV